MSSEKPVNTNQKVKNSYFSEFERIFGPRPDNTIGSYKWNPLIKEMVKINDVAKVQLQYQSTVEQIRDIGPITIKRREDVT